MISTEMKLNLMNLAMLMLEIKSSGQNPLAYQKGSKVSFYNAVLYALVFKVSQNIDFITDENEIEKAIVGDTYQKLKKYNKRRPKA